jgi:SAM-dependent methyltransferase
VKDAFGPEISDLIVDFDPDTLARRRVVKREVVARLEAEGRRAPLRVAQRLSEDADGMLDPREIDGILVRSHLELQRLHEEFRVGRSVRAILAPLVALARGVVPERPLRIVDIGCGLGFVARWLAAYGELGDDVEIIGVDYNEALVHAASELARAERTPVTFVAANAFRLSPPAHLYMSTGVLHHFRGQDLGRLFREHARARAFGFLHLDIRPSLISPLGSWIFHQARMREPLARWDGYWSAVRAHAASTLIDAARDGAPNFTTATVDAHPGIHALVRIFQALVGVRAEFGAALTPALAGLGRRVHSAHEGTL